jgi:hypothetical protein
MSNRRFSHLFARVRALYARVVRRQRVDRFSLYGFADTTGTDQGVGRWLTFEEFVVAYASVLAHCPHHDARAMYARLMPPLS